MANITSTDVADILKELYPNGAPPEVVYKDCPLFALVMKDESFEGELYKMPIIYGDPQGRSASFTQAQNNQTSGKYEAFDLTTVNDYGLATVNGDVLDSMRSNRGGFVRALKLAMDGALRQISRSAHHAIFRAGTGSLGRVGSYTATQTTFTLSDIRDAVFFEVGMELVASTADGGGSLRDSGNSATVTAVNRRTGVITTDSAWDTQISGFAANDYVFVEGDYDAKMKGLDAWVPSSDPGATAFFGVARNVDTQRLGGVRYDGSSQNITEALIDGDELVCESGGSPDVCIIHPRQRAALVKELGAKVQYSRRDTAVKTSTGATLGFRSIVIDGAKGPIDVISDYNCQSNVAWMLTTDTWKLVSMGKVPKLLDDDGLPYLRVYNADALELRVVYRANLGCNAPGYNGRITLPSL